MYFEQYCSIGTYGTAHSRQAFPTPRNPDTPAAWPDFSTWIPPMQLRRMSTCIRLGIAASATCLELSGRDRYDGPVHVGTALGMLSDSELFLRNLIEREEQMLTPTAFIQSTHNTVAGSIALRFGSHGHNMTFADGGHSFENALWDAELLLHEQGGVALIGATDECTPTSLSFMKFLDLYPEDVPAGEGAAFFLVNSQRTAESIARLAAFDCLHVVEAGKEVLTAFSHFLKHAGDVRPGDHLVTGLLDGERHAPVYRELHKHFFNDNNRISYKQWSGDYPTASATGLSMALEIQKRHPESNTWLISNWGSSWSFWKLEA